MPRLFMAVCRWCKKEGMSVTVDARGVCGVCAPELALRIDQAQRRLNRSVKLAGQTTRIGKQLQRWAVVENHAKTLRPFEGSDVLQTGQPPSHYLRLYQDSRDRILHSELGTQVDQLIKAAQEEATVRGAVALGKKAAALVAEARAVADDSAVLRELALKVRNFVNDVQVEALLDKARRAEKRGQVRKAVEQYKGALYFLLNDDIDDRVQREEINEIRKKVALLTGETNAHA